MAKVQISNLKKNESDPSSIIKYTYDYLTSSRTKIMPASTKN